MDRNERVFFDFHFMRTFGHHHRYDMTTFFFIVTHIIDEWSSKRTFINMKSHFEGILMEIRRRTMSTVNRAIYFLSCRFPLTIKNKDLQSLVIFRLRELKSYRNGFSFIILNNIHSIEIDFSFLYFLLYYDSPGNPNEIR